MIKKRFSYEYKGNNECWLLDTEKEHFYIIDDSEENVELLCYRLNKIIKSNKRLKEIIMHSYEVIVCENCKHCICDEKFGEDGTLERIFGCKLGNKCSLMIHVSSCEDFDVDIDKEWYFDWDVYKKSQEHIRKSVFGEYF